MIHSERMTVTGARKRPSEYCRLAAPMYCPRACSGAYLLTKLCSTGVRITSPTVKMTTHPNNSHAFVVNPTKNMPMPNSKEDKRKTFRSLQFSNHLVTGRAHRTNRRPLIPSIHPKISVLLSESDQVFHESSVCAGTNSFT